MSPLSPPPSGGVTSRAPVVRQRCVEDALVVALAGHVAAKAKEGGDVDAVHVLRVLHVAAQVELGQDALARLLLKCQRQR